MTRPRPSYMPTPRIWSAVQVACRLGRGETWLRGHLDDLYEIGFPRPDDFFEAWDADAIELWLDRRAGIVNAEGEDDGTSERLDAFARGQ